MVYESNYRPSPVVYGDELMHYGVKGMKWGRRKAPTSVGNAKAAYKSAKKAYNKSFNKAYNYSGRHAIGQYINKDKRAESDRRWNDAANKAAALRTAKANYKKTKADYKRSKVADYDKKFDESERTQTIADKSYAEMRRQYKALGKNALSRAINSGKDTAAAKSYRDAWAKTNADQERADSANRAMKDAYRKTGRNAVSRVVNNARYGK